MRTILLNGKLEHPFEHWLQVRMKKKNKNFMGVFVNDTGSGKCLVGGSKVLMANGEFKKIEDVKIGDEVISFDKKGNSIFARVIDTNNYYCNDIYSIRERARNKRVLYKCSNNHLIPLIYLKYNLDKKNKEIAGSFVWEKRLKTAEELSKMSEIPHRMYSYSTPLISKFKGRTNPDIDAYCLGFWLGDGHFVNSSYKNRVCRQLGVTTADFEVMEYFSSKYEIMSVSKKAHGNKAKTFYFSVKGEFSKRLEEMGLEGKGSGSKFIPKKALFADKGYRIDLLSGLIDSDGYISKKGGISITTKSERLAEDVVFLVHSLGGFATKKEVKKRCTTTNAWGVYFRVNISFKERILRLKVKRKKERYKNMKIEGKNHINRTHVTISAKKEDKGERVYGITISGPTQLFVTDNYMVTHNSYSALSLAEAVDPKFSVNRVALSASEMVKILTTERLNKGSVVVLDEAGVNFSSQKWYEPEAKALNELFQTFRFMNVAVLMTLPNYNFLNAGQRRLTHFAFEMTSIDYKNNLAYALPKKFVLRPFSKESGFDYVYPIIRYPNGRYYKVKHVAFRKPSPELIKAYEQKKAEWFEKLRKRIYSIVVKGVDPSKKKKKQDLVLKYQLDDKLLKIALKIKGSLDEYIKWNNKSGWVIDPVSIRADYEIKTLEAERIARYLRKDENVKSFLLVKTEEERSKKKLKKLNI